MNASDFPDDARYHDISVSAAENANSVGHADHVAADPLNQMQSGKGGTALL